MKKIILMILSIVAGYQANATIYQVTTSSDNASGLNPGAYAGTGTLRQAIVDANAHAGLDTIVFKIVGGSTVKNLQLLANLPIITSPTFLNGYSQSGALQNTIGASRIIAVEIDANKMTTGGGRTGATLNGLFRFTAGATGSSLCGLAIYNTGNGIEAVMIQPGTSNIRIWGNYIGLLANGSSPAAAQYNGNDGIILGDYNTLSGSFTNIFIGTDGNGINDANEGNVISNAAANTGTLSTSGGDGIQIGVFNSGPVYSSYTYLNVRVCGNYIGLAADGVTAAPNGVLLTTIAVPGYGEDGINLVQASNILIGSVGTAVADTLQRNIISGNYGNGINSGAQNTSGRNNGNAGKIHISGNYIGTDKRGMVSVPNGVNNKFASVHGIGIGYATSNLVIGFDDSKHTAAFADVVRNVISGNFGAGGPVANGAANGINISNCTGINNQISGNYIGVASDGVSSLGNGWNGIAVSASGYVLIGSDGNGTLDAYERNVISGNYASGISVTGGNDIRVQGNFIGTDKTGLVAVSNGKRSSGTSLFAGIDLNGSMSGLNIGFSANSNILSAAADVRNVISGNDSYGIRFVSVSGLGNSVSGNYIGVNASGNTALGNGQRNNSSIPGSGIVLDASSDLLIGSTGDGLADEEERNVVGGAVFGFGLYLFNGSEWSRVQGNNIGVGADGTSAVGNGWSGIRLGSTTAGSYASNNQIGSDDSGDENDATEGNIIANNGNPSGSLSQRSGISVVSNSTSVSAGNRISRNIFYNNKGLPIDLNSNGITLNDGLLTSTGSSSANLSLDYPVITSASIVGSIITVNGYVSTCGGNETVAGPDIAGAKMIQFYKEASDGDQFGALTNGSCSRSVSHGEGIQYLGSIYGIVNTFSASFTLEPGATLTASDRITGITIDENGNTSEFGVFALLNILPVDLIKLTARPDKKNVLLQWTTATEFNNRGFEIQRSEDGIHFMTIGFVKSAAEGGNSSLPLQYNFVDAKPSNAANYYRLKQVDIDGKVHHSNIVNVPVTNHAELQMHAYPNPVVSGLRIVISGVNRFNRAHLLLYTSLGQLVSRTAVNTGELKIDCSKLQDGVYFLVYSDGSGNQLQAKFTK